LATSFQESEIPYSLLKQNHFIIESLNF